MKNNLFAGAAALALFAGAASAQDLKFAPGEDARFHWDSYEALKSMDLSGQEVSILGPWLGPDKDLVESMIAYFEAATGANGATTTAPTALNSRSSSTPRQALRPISPCSRNRVWRAIWPRRAS